MRDALRAGMTARMTPVRLVVDTAPPPGAPGGALVSRRARVWGLGLLAGLVIILAVVLVRAGGEEERALRRLPPAERAALYHRTMDTLTSVCAGERRDELRDLCSDQARLVLLFPECDASCQTTAREQLRTPTR